MPFMDRVSAGQCLASRLDLLRGQVVVLGLPRGGVPVAFQTAAALDAPLDVVLVHKLTVPSWPDVTMTVIGEDGVRVRDDTTIKATSVGLAEIMAAERAGRIELDRQLRRFRGNRTQIPLYDRNIVVVDDLMATGASMTVACRLARSRGADMVIAAVPIATPTAITRLTHEADEVICLEISPDITTVEHCYADPHQTTDDDVALLLTHAAPDRPHHTGKERAP
jgi:putative phosphoribosyl transferase